MKHEGERLLKMPEVAEHIGTSTRTVYRLIAEGALPKPVHVRAGSRLPLSDVRAYQDKLKQRRRR